MLEYDLNDIGDEENNLDLNERQMLLLSLNDDLLIDSIEEQINNPSSVFYEKSNYVEVFEDRYKYIVERFKDIPDLLQEVSECRSIFYGKVFNLVANHYGIELDTDTNENNMYIMTKVLYEFLVLNYTDNVKAFVLQYISLNKKPLAQEFASEKTKLDASSARKLAKNPNDVIILTNMYKVIDYIVSLELSVTEILRYIITDDESEFNNYFMNQYFIQEEVLESNKFTRVFCSILRRENDNFIRIVNEIQLDYLQSIR